MALNSSGPISLGGTVAGQSIELENGGSGTTQISLNDTAVRSLAGVPSGMIVMPLNFWGKSNQAYWIANSSITEPTDVYGTSVDSSGNIYIAATTTTGEDQGLIIKLNNLGSVQWSTLVTNTLLSTYGLVVRGLTVLSNGNIAVGGDYQVASTRRNMYFFEINSSTGALIGSSRNQQGTSQSTRAWSIQATSDGGFIASAATTSGTNAYFSTQKFPNVTGAPTWGVRSTISTGTAQKSAEASNGNIVTVGSSGSPSKLQALSTNSSGAVAYHFTSSTTTNHVFFDVVCIGTDSYMAGYATNGTAIQAYVAKYDVNGTLIWGRTLYSSPNQTFSTAMDKDSQGNIYVAWNLSNGGASPNRYGTLIVKYNSSGVLQWQREFNRSTTNAMIKVVNDNTFVLTCNTLGTTLAIVQDGLWFCQLPTDGSKTGTYTVNGKSVTYSVSSWTEASYTVATATSTNTTVAATTLATTAQTTSSPSISNTITNI